MAVKFASTDRPTAEQIERRRPVFVVVVGHVQWAHYVTLCDVPRPGGMVDSFDSFSAPGGGAAVAAWQLRHLGAEVMLHTMLATDSPSAAFAGLAASEGIHLTAPRCLPFLPHSVVLLDLGHAERWVAALEEPKPPSLGGLADQDLGAADAVLVTSASDGLMRRLRKKTALLVLHARAIPTLESAGVRADVVVGSARDAYERGLLDEAGSLAGVVVITDADRGGSYRVAGCRTRRWRPADVQGPPVDSCGCGANFLAGLAFGLATGSLEDAVELGALCGAACIGGRGPFEAQPRVSSTMRA